MSPHDQAMDTFPRIDIPHPTRRVIAPADDPVPRDVEAANARRVAFEHAQAGAELDVPDAERGVAGTGYGDGAVVEDADGGGVPVEGVDALSVWVGII